MCRSRCSRKQFKLIFFIAATIVLSSTAGAAEYMGGHLGEYVEEGEYGGRPYFKQRDTEGSKNSFLYSKEGKWVVGKTLGGSSSIPLKNNQDTPLPPTDQWLYWENDWNDGDTSLTLEFTALSPCQLVRVSGEGNSNQHGDYR